jgi:hypothetical protein
MPGKVILTLDIATVTGWAVSQPGRNGPLYGSHRMVSGTIGDDLGRALAAFRDWLTDMLAIHNPDEIWFEAPVPTTNRSIATMRLLMAYPAFAEELAYRRNTPIFEAHSGTIRKAGPKSPTCCAGRPSEATHPTTITPPTRCCCSPMRMGVRCDAGAIFAQYRRCRRIDTSLWPYTREAATGALGRAEISFRQFDG